MSALPASAYCGDSLAWTATVSASGMTGKAVFRHIETGQTITATPTVSGNVWSFELPPEASLEKPPGLYVVAIITELAGTRETVNGGKITLMAPIDRPERESHAQKMVRLLEAHLEGRIDDEEGRGMESYTIGGVPISKIGIERAKALLAEYKIDVQQEVAQRQLEAGLGSRGRIFTQFES